MSEISDELRQAALSGDSDRGTSELMGRAAAVLDNRETETRDLRVQLDGWKQYFKLRRDVSEIENILRDAPQTATAFYLRNEIGNVVRRIVGREI